MALLLLGLLGKPLISKGGSNPTTPPTSANDITIQNVQIAPSTGGTKDSDEKVDCLDPANQSKCQFIGMRAYNDAASGLYATQRIFIEKLEERVNAAIENAEKEADRDSAIKQALKGFCDPYENSKTCYSRFQVTAKHYRSNVYGNLMKVSFEQEKLTSKGQTARDSRETPSSGQPAEKLLATTPLLPTPDEIEKNKKTNGVVYYKPSDLLLLAKPTIEQFVVLDEMGKPKKDATGKEPTGFEIDHKAFENAEKLYKLRHKYFGKKDDLYKLYDQQAMNAFRHLSGLDNINVKSGVSTPTPSEPKEDSVIIKPKFLKDFQKRAGSNLADVSSLEAQLIVQENVRKRKKNAVEFTFKPDELNQAYADFKSMGTSNLTFQEFEKLLKQLSKIEYLKDLMATQCPVTLEKAKAKDNPKCLPYLQEMIKVSNKMHKTFSTQGDVDTARGILAGMEKIMLSKQLSKIGSKSDVATSTQTSDKGTQTTTSNHIELNVDYRGFGATKQDKAKDQAELARLMELEKDQKNSE